MLHLKVKVALWIFFTLNLFSYFCARTYTGIISIHIYTYIYNTSLKMKIITPRIKVRKVAVTPRVYKGWCAIQKIYSPQSVQNVWNNSFANFYCTSNAIFRLQLSTNRKLLVFLLVETEIFPFINIGWKQINNEKKLIITISSDWWLMIEVYVNIK